MSLVQELDKDIIRKENYVETNMTYEERPKNPRQYIPEQCIPEFEPPLDTAYKNSLKIDKDLNSSVKAIKLLGKKTGIKFCDLGFIWQ